MTVRPGRPVPASTYRLQITEGFDLHQAARRLPYLHDLGVDWVYLSPLLEAEAGSDHGYDVLRHDRIDPARGGAAGLAAVSAEARRLGMGVLVDIVPNHVGIATPTPGTWWWDVLQHGRSSAFATAFDIDWDAGGGQIQVPILGDDDLDGAGSIGHLEVRDQGDGGGDGARLAYHDNEFPIAPGTGAGSAAEVHDRQAYRLVSWRAADSELNYRRFFAVNTLAAIRVELPEVFEASHVEIRRWFDEGLVDGLRVDHPDGLREPARYLDDLATLTGGAYVLVEKILEPGETMPTTWATAGTTGYDALAHIDRVLTDPAGDVPLAALTARLTGRTPGEPLSWRTMIHGTKRAVADGILNSEVKRIVRELPDLGLEAGTLEDGVAELMACFPVYRSYLPEGRDHLDEAMRVARERRPDLGATLDALDPVLGDPAADAAIRFQQTSGMVMAKGVEDCAFYRWSQLTSLDEVGGDPSVFSLGVDGFHELMVTRQEHWPTAMTCLSTHDTKRGEDVRARITVLAEIPEVWSAALERLLTLAPLPDPVFGSLLWQAILGAWPADEPADLRDRLQAYAEKAMREAGDHTEWTDPDRPYEDAVHRAVSAAFDSEPVREVLAELLGHVVAPGWSNALAAKLVSITMPGVPDVYQGSELWEQSLVDPDNRRPVDFDERDALLSGIIDGAGVTLGISVDDVGAAKLALVHRALTLRRERPDLFTSYAAVPASGDAAGHLLAFDRGGAVTVATRLPVGLRARGGWADTVLDLAPGVWFDHSGQRSVVATEAGLPVGELLSALPAALLTMEDA